jgi:Icc-related predicted phosphoesterase
MTIKIVAISDVHCRFKKLIIPECDILISCGDYSFRGLDDEVRLFHEWLHRQPAKHVISVQGNHEKLVEKDFERSRQIALKACPRVYFIDEGLIELEGLRIWCSAITPYFCDWAWNRYRGQEIKEHWDKIPNDIDILVTHGPPYGILDKVVKQHPAGHKVDTFLGCVDLLEKIEQIPTLKHHFFGHIHEGYGHEEIKDVNYWNVSICDKSYNPTNLPIVVDI